MNRVIVQAVLRHLVPVRSEHGDLGGHALILAAWLLVEVVRHQNVHRNELLIRTKSTLSKPHPLRDFVLTRLSQFASDRVYFWCRFFNMRAPRRCTLTILSVGECGGLSCEPTHESQ